MQASGDVILALEPDEPLVDVLPGPVAAVSTVQYRRLKFGFDGQVWTAWVVEDDGATQQRIIDSLNAIAGMCRLAVKA